MTGQLIDGKEISRQIQTEIATEVERLKVQGIHPGLGVILVGENPASLSYVSAKEKACIKCGVASRVLRFPATITQTELSDQIKNWGHDSSIHGILVQLPLPAHIKEDEVIGAIPPQKDVDGFHPVNVGKLLIGDNSGFAPCTPAGIVELLIRSGFPPAGRYVVIVGRSNIVGKPLAALLIQKNEKANATVTVCHSQTPDLARFTRQADILIAAIGRPQAITAEMVRPAAVVIDVGVNRVNDSTVDKGYRLTGDVDFEAVKPIAAAITPVPGGVGPMTIAMLLKNTVQAARQLASNDLQKE